MPNNDLPITATEHHWATPEQVGFAQMCFAYLQISPSYDLARKHHLGLLTQAEWAKLPADINVVLGVYDMLGDLNEIGFNEWWSGKGIRAFGYEGARPRTMPIDFIWPTKSGLAAGLNKGMNDYLAGQFQQQDPQACLIMAIPMTLPKSEILEQMRDFLDEVPDAIKATPRRMPDYPLYGQKQNLRSLIRYMKCAMCRLDEPALKLWQIGVIAELSTTYSARLATDKGTPDDQQELKMLASRALRRAGLVAENAARGRFPTYEKCEHAIKPDWVSMGDVFGDNEGWADGLDGYEDDDEDKA